MSKQKLIAKACGALVEHQTHLAGLSVADLEWVNKYGDDSVQLFVEAVKNRQNKKTENILWQNGPHKIVKNDDGTVSAWMDCDQIDWSQSNQEALDATGRKQRTDPEVVSEMPRGEKLTGIKEVVFRNYNCRLSDDKLAEKTTEHGHLISPFFQIKINGIFPELADEYHNGNHWKDSGDKWCFAAFHR